MKTVNLAQESGTFLDKPSYTQFCVQIPKFCVNMETGIGGQVRMRPLNWQTSKTPTLIKIWDTSHIEADNTNT